jgi:hypothetical protein
MKFIKKISRVGDWWHWLFGLGAFLWIILRSVTNPKRLAYPCQQAAMPIAVNWILAVAAFLGGSILMKRCAKLCGIVAVLGGAVWFVVSNPGFLRSETSMSVSTPLWNVDSPVSTVFVLDSIPLTTGSLAAGDATVPDEYLSDPAMDTLFELLEAGGVYLCETTAHSDGIVGTDNVVIIKGNYQWNSRNTTNTDRVKGLIWQILNHPEGFTGEIIVCDNTQDIGTGFNFNDNNSEDENQDILNVVNTFAAKGYPVYCMDWNMIMASVVSEYSDGDNFDGYVFDAQTKVNYPKFNTPSFSHQVSLKHGIWDSLSATYDPDRLCIIDFPVLKAHFWAGSTVAIKNWIGVFSIAYADQDFGDFNTMHTDYLFGPYALTARIMAETYPDLSIVDATWTTRKGPIDLDRVTRTDVIFASTDPAAVSWYAAKYVLTPIAYSASQTDPDNPGGTYSINLNYWTEFLRDSAGYACTIDSAEMSVFGRNIITDSDADGTVDAFDNCPAVFNDDQLNSDNDRLGDACDNCPFADNDNQINSDTDSFGDACDNCPDIDNEDQADTDLDGIGDVCDYICGDANGDGDANVGDAVFMINYVFKGGPAPDPVCVGDANGDRDPNVGDAVYLINYVFKGGPAPDENCCP